MAKEQGRTHCTIQSLTVGVLRRSEQRGAVHCGRERIRWFLRPKRRRQRRSLFRGAQSETSRRRFRPSQQGSSSITVSVAVASLPALQGPCAPPAERGPSLESVHRVSLTVIFAKVIR